MAVSFGLDMSGFTERVRQRPSGIVDRGKHARTQT